MHRVSTTHLLARFGAILLLGASAACDASGGRGSGTDRLGLEGDSCLRTADCEAPLRCLANVCADANGLGDADARVGDAEASGADVGFIGAAADVEEADALAPSDDVTGGPPDPDAVAELLADLLGPDALSPEDLGPPPELPPSGDVSAFSACDAVGIAPSWSGEFAGYISYQVPFDIPGANSSDSLPVEGTLAFEVACIEKKLIVSGDMKGTALGEYPFTLHLSGSYNPQTAQLDAKIKDGAVALFDFGTGAISVYFEGTFTGALDSDAFSGVWQGEAVGTDPPGIPGTATGLGTWTATAQ